MQVVQSVVSRQVSPREAESNWQAVGEAFASVLADMHVRPKCSTSDTTKIDPQTAAIRG